MSKDIRIDHESTVHTYTGISKIRTSKIEGGSQDWVPEDEHGDYINAGDIEITQNGTYLPQDYGYDSFRTVTVAMGDNEGPQEELQVTDPNTDFSYLDEDGEMISDMDIPAIVPVQPVNTIKGNKYKGPKTVSGIDPSTGEPTAVSLDENRNIVKTPIPYRIAVIIPPGVSTTYNEGDTINYDQYTYLAYKANGDPFPIYEDALIPNLIHLDEMEFPVEKAHVPDSGSSSGSSSSGGSHISGDF